MASTMAGAHVVPLRSLVFVIDAGSLTEAARRLGITPSGVSRHISRLEEALGARLLERTTRSVRATLAGRELYRRVRPLFDAFEEAEAAVRELQDDLAGSVRISAAPAFGRACLLPALAGLSRLHPGLTFDVILTGRRLDFVEDEIDLAVREGALADSSLTVQKLSMAEVILCAAPDYVARAGAPRRLADLERHAMLSLRGDAAARLRSGHPALRALELKARFEVDDLFALRELCEGGVGIAALPDYVARPALASGSLVALLPRTSIARFPIHLVYPSRRHLPRRLVAVMDALRAQATTPSR